MEIADDGWHAAASADATLAGKMCQRYRRTPRLGARRRSPPARIRATGAASWRVDRHHQVMQPPIHAHDCHQVTFSTNYVDRSCPVSSKGAPRRRQMSLQCLLPSDPQGSTRRRRGVVLAVVLLIVLLVVNNTSTPPKKKSAGGGPASPSRTSRPTSVL